MIKDQTGASRDSVPAISILRIWLDRNVIDLGRQMRLSYVPPLMVYLAAGISGLTGIVGTFFVKEYLGLSAEFLAALSFWTMLPWALKMPMGHLVDLLWRHKAGLIYLGASLIAISLMIMINLLGDPDYMRAVWPVENWYVLSALLAPIGYVIQDTVADAMTVEAVSVHDEEGRPLPEQEILAAHTTMQTLGRVAIIGGSVLVAGVNVAFFQGADTMEAAEKAAVYLSIYRWALWVPVISILGVVLSAYLRSQEEWRLAAQGLELDEIKRRSAAGQHETPAVNWTLLGGGLGFALFAAVMGLGGFSNSEEIVFIGSLAIVLFLMWRLTRDLDGKTKNRLYGTAFVIFAFRAVPTAGAGETWWMIDDLGFDQQFISKLSLIASGLTLVGMFLFRRFMAERPITYIIAVLTVVLALLYIPNIALYYGLHHWTSEMTGGVVDARFIALVDTALESPLGQIAMIPMLAWIANSAPKQLKATYFAVMAAFVNLALSLSQLLTKWLNQGFVITREVRDAATGQVVIAADYSELGWLLIVVMGLNFAIPVAAILFAQRTWLKD
jgi:hypothetical protein